MKKLLTLLAVCLAMPAMAQDNNTTVAVQEQALVYENPTLPVYLGEVTYEPLSRAEKTTTVLTGLLNDEITYEDESMVKGAKEALANVLYDIPRLEMKTGKISDEDMGKCLVYSAKIVFCNFSEKRNLGSFDKEGRIVAFVTLTNPATKQVVLNKQVMGESWLSQFESEARCRDYTMHNLRVAAGRSLREAYPLRGHMLDRGLVKGSKDKLKQFYIDLGVEQKMLTGMLVDVYIIRRVAGRVAHQFVGSGKVYEVEGANLSVCEVTKNGNKIKDAWERGAEIAVRAY